ncbi:uncharacterized protein TRAVEDRAFT_134083 [Trametes versicolor FP-101664 SS1]|uniref:uncharacterized protein n=1 Tax=Trametes versicolor (strain FP-101664) TaxID=717944 RepID=UPI0004623674|nr:uncharacterized protein TRAVEDRAFT_134083 [Trametes versicolor FP-101664 SS1]EIW53509.1 hypothetical protein TRAVEDRAFT_134083 [Trametes versicolor FP-101664 SS1]
MPDPLHEVRYLKDPVPLNKKGFLVRMWYAGCIHHNWRLVGTNVQVANVPPPFKGTRAQYLVRRLRQICLGLVMLDISEAYMHTHLHLFTPGVKEAYFPPGLMGFLARAGCMAVWLVITYTVLNMSYCVLSSAVVATCLSEPADWPDLFGSLYDAYTVRRVWGRVWHQLLRRHFAHWGKLAAHVIGAPRGSFLSSQAQIHGAFLSSAVLHTIADLAIGHGTRYLGNSFKFFLLNGAAVTFEGAVIMLAQRLGVRGPTRIAYMLGYVWTAVWFTWAVRFYQEPLFMAGMGHVPTLPYSPTREVVLPFL